MSRRIFISYSRHDALQAGWLRDTLTTFGHECWLDEVLEGGQSWWTAILRAIEWSDVFIPVMSPRFKTSEACNKELAYASALLRPIIPTQGIGVVGRRDIAGLPELQWVDITPSNPDAPSDIVRAVTKLDPAPPLPDPLPPPPEVPVSYTLQIREVLAREPLNREGQEWVLSEVERRAQLDEEPVDLIELLDALERHDDFLNSLNARRERLRRVLEDSHPSAETPPPPPADPRPSQLNTPPQTAFGGPAPPSPPDQQPTMPIATSTGSSPGKLIGIIAAIIFCLFLVGSCIALLAEASCDPTVEFC